MTMLILQKALSNFHSQSKSRESEIDFQLVKATISVNCTPTTDTKFRGCLRAPERLFDEIRSFGFEFPLAVFPYYKMSSSAILPSFTVDHRQDRGAVLSLTSMRC